MHISFSVDIFCTVWLSCLAPTQGLLDMGNNDPHNPEREKCRLWTYVQYVCMDRWLSCELAGASEMRQEKVLLSTYTNLMSPL